MKEPSIWKLFQQIHEDEDGVVSIETILIIAAIAIPIMIFILKYGWPKIREYFMRGMEDLEEGRQDAIQPN